MNQTEFRVTVGAGILGALQLFFQVLQWYFPDPSALAFLSKPIQILSLGGVSVLIFVFWRKAFSAQPNTRWKKFLLVLSLIAIAYATWIGTRFSNSNTISSESLPVHSQVTNVAWQALLNDEYGLAISIADVCITRYESEAIQIQKGLTASHEVALPIDEQINNKGSRAKVSAQGVLNDVAACYYIKAQAMEKLTRFDEAKAAYQNAQKFPHARVYNPQEDLYWSPEKKATERLIELP